MNKTHNRSFLPYCLFTLCLFVAPVFASVNFVAWDEDGDQWLQQTSAHFSISYLKVQQQSASHVLNIAEQVHQQLFPFFNVVPKKKIEIILLDNFDAIKPHESTLEYGEIRLVMTPPDDTALIETEDDWIRLYLTHEYSYILQMQLAQDSLRGLFISAEFTPSLLLEGVAIYLEKNNQLKNNRLSTSNFNMQMRMQVASADLQDLQQVIIENRQWPLTSTYIYGAYFVDYLVKTYGEEKLLAFLNNYSQSLLSYLFLNTETTKIYGKDFLTLWQEFKVYLNDQFSNEIQQLATRQVNGELLLTSPFLQITSTGTKGLLVNKVNGEDRHQIQQYQQGKWVAITPSRDLVDMDSHPEAGLITSRNINYVDGHRYNDVFHYQDNHWRRLSEKGRFKNIRIMPDGKKILASRIVQGLSELWLLDINDQNNAQQLWQGTENIILGEFDVAPNGEFIVASMKMPLSQWKLSQFDLTSKQWHNLIQQQGNENAPEFLADGSLVFSADYSGIYNIYHLSFDKSALSQWTDVLGGAFQPIWQAGLGLVFQTYGANSYMLRYISEPQTIKLLPLSNQQPNEKPLIVFAPPITLSTPTAYSTWKTIQSHSWLPAVYADEVRSLVGLNTYGGDALGRHNYEVYALWDMRNQLASYFFEYRYDNRWELAYLRDFKFKKISADKANKEYQISRNQTYVFQRNHLYSAWQDKLSFHAGLSLSFDDLIDQPNIDKPLIQQSVSTEVTMGAALTFDNREFYLNVPDVGWGHYYDFTFEENILDSDFNGQKYQSQWRATWDLPGRSTLLTRLAAGYSTDNAKKYTLGGNNLKQEMRLFDRNSQAIRGYNDIAVYGQMYATQRIEFNTWLGRFDRNWGLLPLGLGDIAGTFFIDSGAAWDAGGEYNQITGLGAQMQVELKLGYNYSLPITLGYAHGTDDKLGKEYFFLNFGSSY